MPPTTPPAPAPPARRLTEAGLAFVADYHLATLSTLLPTGFPHLVAVGFTYDAEAGLVRIITNGPSQKALNVRRDGRASVCQVDGARWLTLGGSARVLEDAASVDEAVARYAARYRQPRVNPQRVVIAITLEHAMGSGGLLEG